MLVLIPKEGEKYHSICLVEVVCKVVAVILTFRLTASIAFHSVLRGLRVGRKTGTSTHEEKLIQ